MAGLKLFSNQSQYGMNVTLVIREGDDPRNQAPPKEFQLDANQSQWQEYGSNTAFYLNGIRMSATFQGQRVGQQYIVIDRGSSLDNELNTKNGVDFGFRDNTFLLSTRQVT